MSEDQKDKYIQQNLSDSEKEKLDREIQLNKEEQEEVAIELGVRAAVEEESRKELRKKVEGFENNRPSGGKSDWRWLAVAASIIIVGGVSYLFNVEDSSLYDQYYEAYPNYEYTALRGDEETNLKEKAYAAYDQEQYGDAIGLFTRLIAINEKDSPAIFFRGISYLETGQYESALDDFNLVMASSNEYQEAAIWYTALVHLQLKNPGITKELLNDLIGSEDFAELAHELSSKL